METVLTGAYIDLDEEKEEYLVSFDSHVWIKNIHACSFRSLLLYFFIAAQIA